MSGADPEPREPARRGRLGFSRAALSLVGLLLALAFAVWVFLPW